MNNYPKARNTELVVSELENELLIYDLKINKAYCLNKTSALVWQLSNGKNSISEIGRLMSNQLKTQVSDELVWFALDSLKKDDLLQNSEKLEIEFGGMARREIIKKIGLSSMIALPLISSVVAPVALQAQSCVSLGQSCSPFNPAARCCSTTFCGTSLVGTFGVCSQCLQQGVGYPLSLFPDFTGICQDSYCCSGAVFPLGGGCVCL